MTSTTLYIIYTTITMKEQTSKILGYTGTLFILLMPYVLTYSHTMFLIFAILGNVLLMPQVYTCKQWNLVALNLVGCIGYVINLVTNIIT